MTPAIDQPPLCPQSGAFGTPEEYGFNSGPGDEDCLYLNVYAAPDSTGLPVLVWIRMQAPFLLSLSPAACPASCHWWFPPTTH